MGIKKETFEDVGLHLSNEVMLSLLVCVGNVSQLLSAVSKNLITVSPLRTLTTMKGHLAQDGKIALTPELIHTLQYIW